MAMPCRFSCKLALYLSFSTALTVLFGFSAKAQASETLSVDSSNGGMALNTNNSFRRIDGQPRMSIWQRNNSDPDQLFDRLPGNRGGTLLKHRSTGKCINAHYLSNGAEFNVWDCNPNDPDQNFVITSLGNGYNQIRRANTNLCIDSPTRTNGGRVHLWTCDVNNPNQRWRRGGVSSSWSLPWSGKNGTLTQGWHYDEFNATNNAIDIGLPAGTPVLAPTDSTVDRFCNAGNNHLSIRLKASNGNYYSLIHVTASGLSVGKQYRRGEQIGVIAGDRPWNNCAKSTGSHLHLGLPSQNFTLGNYTLTSQQIPSTFVP